jgi:hypothetical protein
MFSNFFQKLCHLWENVEKYWGAGQATNDNLVHAPWINEYSFVSTQLWVQIHYSMIYLKKWYIRLHNLIPCKLKSWVYRDIKCDLYLGIWSAVVSLCNSINHVSVTGNQNTEWFQVPRNLESKTKAVNQETAIWTYRLWISKSCLWSNVCNSATANYVDGVKLLKLEGYIYNTHTINADI